MLSGRSPAPPPEYHLAWYLPHVSGVISQGAPVRYLLVPVALEKYQATHKFQVISQTGRPQGELETFVSRVASLRPPATPEGAASPQELQLIASLRERATLAGLAKALPELRPTLTAPAWSRAVISPGTRLQMVKAGGA